MNDITSKPYAHFLEELIKGMLDFEPEKIAVVAVNNQGEVLCAHNGCTPFEMFGMAGALQNEGTWTEIKANGEMLNDIIENSKNESGEE